MKSNKHIRKRNYILKDTSPTFFSSIAFSLSLILHMFHAIFFKMKVAFASSILISGTRFHLVP